MGDDVPNEFLAKIAQNHQKNPQNNHKMSMKFLQKSTRKLISIFVIRGSNFMTKNLLDMANFTFALDILSQFLRNECIFMYSFTFRCFFPF